MILHDYVHIFYKARITYLDILKYIKNFLFLLENKF